MSLSCSYGSRKETLLAAGKKFFVLGKSPAGKRREQVCINPSLAPIKDDLAALSVSHNFKSLAEFLIRKTMRNH